MLSTTTTTQTTYVTEPARIAFQHGFSQRTVLVQRDLLQQMKKGSSHPNAIPWHVMMMHAPCVWPARGGLQCATRMCFLCRCRTIVCTRCTGRQWRGLGCRSSCKRAPPEAERSEPVAAAAKKRRTSRRRRRLRLWSHQRRRDHPRTGGRRVGRTCPCRRRRSLSWWWCPSASSSSSHRKELARLNGREQCHLHHCPCCKEERLYLGLVGEKSPSSAAAREA